MSSSDLAMGWETRSSANTSSRTSAETVAYIALGSNLSLQTILPAEIVAAAVTALGSLGRVRARSGFWRSEAWPNTDDPPFVNAVAALETTLAPDALLAALHRIEAGFGRRRDRGVNAPRTLDLDLLDSGGHILAADGAATSALVLPHPRMMSRAFVLAPLLDVAPAWRHPATGVTARAALSAIDPGARGGLSRLDLLIGEARGAIPPAPSH